MNDKNIVGPEAYRAVFEDSSAGRAILAQLTLKYEGGLYKEGDAFHSIYKIGQRDVVKFIRDMCKQGDK